MFFLFCFVYLFFSLDPWICCFFSRPSILIGETCKYIASKQISEISLSLGKYLKLLRKYLQITEKTHSQGHPFCNLFQNQIIPYHTIGGGGHDHGGGGRAPEIWNIYMLQPLQNPPSPPWSWYPSPVVWGGLGLVVVVVVGVVVGLVVIVVVVVILTVHNIM